MALVAQEPESGQLEREAMLPPKKRKRQALEAAEQSLGQLLGGPDAASCCDSQDSREPAPRPCAEGAETQSVGKDGAASSFEAADLALARALQEAENVRPAVDATRLLRPASAAAARALRLITSASAA